MQSNLGVNDCSEEEVLLPFTSCWFLEENLLKVTVLNIPLQQMFEVDLSNKYTAISFPCHSNLSQLHVPLDTLLLGVLCAPARRTLYHMNNNSTASLMY